MEIRFARDAGAQLETVATGRRTFELEFSTAINHCIPVDTVRNADARLGVVTDNGRRGDLNFDLCARGGDRFHPPRHP